MGLMGYRQDNRDDKTFRQDIKKGTIAEREILQRWLAFLERHMGFRPRFDNNGCDNTGEFLSDKNVSAAADYRVQGYGLVEIKFSYPKLRNVFHLKADQVRKLIMDKAYILFANGWATSNPEFCLISPRRLASITNNMPEIPWHGFGDKLSYKIAINQFTWKAL